MKKKLLITALLLAVILTGSMATPVSATIIIIQNSVTINGGAAETGFLDVVLSLTQGLAIVGNPVVSMQFTNLDPAVYFDAWMGIAWLPYSNTKEWTLTPGGPGSRTVWARYQLQDGTISTVFSDSIYYIGGGIALPDSVTINGGAATTKTLDVTLTLYRSPRKYAQEVVSMSFWVEGEPPVIAEWSDYEPWASTKEFHLFPSGLGTKTVNVHYRLRDGTTTATFSDTIEVATTPPQGSVTINGGAQSTSSRDVTLTLSATDDSKVVQMRFSNDGSSWSSWQSYATSKSWTLSASDGTKTVHVQFKDDFGLTAEAIDTIVLDQTPDVVATPTFSPGAGTYSSSQSVTITCSTSGATIRYTLDGSEPTSSSAVYSSPIEVSSTATIKTKAFKSGMTDSATASATYTIQVASDVVATPGFSPSAGTYSSSQSVTISCGTSGATIRYTLDGSEPTSSSATYSGPISVNTGTVTIKAKASKSGMTDSGTASVTYTIGESWSTLLWSMFGPLGILSIAILAIASILLWRRKK